MVASNNTAPSLRSTGLLALRLCFAGVLLAIMQIAVAAQTVPSVSDPIRGDTSFEQGLLALKENRFDAALEKLTAAERQRPNDAKVRNFRGIALAGIGRPTE